MIRFAFAVSILVFAHIFPVNADENQSETTFIGSYDIPLADGLVIDEDQFVELDKPEGQISEYSALGGMSAESILSYYQSAMPELGWALVSKTAQDLMFSREKDKVTIQVSHGDASNTIVTFRITSTN